MSRASTAEEILSTVEEVLGTYGERRLKELLKPTDELSNEKLHTIRGQAIAVHDVLRTLRTTIGYDPDSL